MQRREVVSHRRNQVFCLNEGFAKAKTEVMVGGVQPTTAIQVRGEMRNVVSLPRSTTLKMWLNRGHSRMSFLNLTVYI